VCKCETTAGPTLRPFTTALIWMHLHSSVDLTNSVLHAWHMAMLSRFRPRGQLGSLP